MRKTIVGVSLVVAMLLMTAIPAFAAGPEATAIEAVCSVVTLPEPDLTGTASVPEPAVEIVYRETAGDRSTWETATIWDGAFWSRRGGDDFVAKLANARAGYTFQVLKGRKVVHSEAVSLCDPYVTIPVGDEDGLHSRTFRFVAASGTGPSVTATFGVDTIAPVIATQAQTSPTSALVTFSEPIVDGSDTADHWFVRWGMAGAEGTTEVDTTVETVQTVDSQTRTLTWSPPIDTFVGVNYAAWASPADRYLDKAGNGLADTL